MYTLQLSWNNISYFYKLFLKINLFIQFIKNKTATRPRTISIPSSSSSSSKSQNLEINTNMQTLCRDDLVTSQAELMGSPAPKLLYLDIVITDKA